ncbi:bifunctional 3-(3-hydroxy-phenyl)propionate/3-hydroxycinnamic acid hydroxylase [Arenibacterium sp. LLYu02]|uniref:bifunctional 3-(3-hydroxy-phenyl)propionate/3-hydroxycinnamic acid hydroxylase n=1 Tax=Arenibacterium sp. LLYu02 TaxID=3404132 RepID=UPI003B227EC9
MTYEAEVLIVGAGPTGLTLANLLGTMGVRTLLVERNRSTVDEPRAVSIDDESMRTMQAIGLSGAVAATTSVGYGSIYRGPDGRPFSRVMPRAREYGFDKRNGFQQPVLEATLRDGLARFPSVTTLFGSEVTTLRQDDQGVTASMEGPEGATDDIRARYAVGCDGARSFVRKTLGLRFEGGTFEEPWLIVDLARTENRCRHTEVFCNAARSCITLPGPDGIRRYEFLLKAGETAEQAETEAFARGLLRQFGPDGDAPIRRIKVYTFHALLAERWRIGRVFLAGDAAHLTPPFAGQGMNSGLRDAHNLAWKLAEAVRGGASKVFLDSYEIERKPHAKAMIDLALRMGQVMMPKSALQGFLVRSGFRLLSIYPPARDYVALMKYKPKPQFREGLVWFGERQADGMVGRLIGQPLVEDVARRRGLLDECLPAGPVVLVFDETPESALSAASLDRFADLGVPVIGLTPEGINPQGAAIPVFRDVSGQFSANPKDGLKGSAFLLRPDRYIAAMRPVSRSEELIPFVRQIHPSGRGQSLAAQAEKPATSGRETPNTTPAPEGA